MTTWKVPQFQTCVGADEAAAVAECVQSGWITEGPRCAEFVERVKQIAGVKYGVLAPNGTLALYMALKACGVGEGWEVIVPDLTFVASATAVVMAGAKPVFVDVNQWGQLDSSRALDAAESRIVHTAMMPVHLYGSGCSSAVAVPPAGVLVIEDACQGLGVTIDGRPCGSLGLASAFSFFADKTVTTGEGGFVGTNDETVYERLRYLRNQGRIDRGSFVHPMIGQNFRMTDLQAAVGLVQLDRLDWIVARKLAHHDYYRHHLAGTVCLLEPMPGSTHIPFRTVAFFDQPASEAAEFLRAHGIEPRSAFYPLHKQPCFDYRAEDMRHADALFPNTNYFWKHALCLPTFAGMTEEQLDLVCRVVRAYVRGEKT